MINIRAERAFYGRQIGAVPVTGKLDAVGERGRQIVHEPHGIFRIATANEIGVDELGVGTKSSPPSQRRASYMLSADLAPRLSDFQ
jgi:hypothetical protein